MTRHIALLHALKQATGPGAVRTDQVALRLAAADLYEAGPEPVAVVRPENPDDVARAIAAAVEQGYAVVPRGGGLSYTGGYSCARDQAILLDLAGLDQIEEVSATDMFVAAQAGATWKQLLQRLAPLGLRLPFFGTFSGAGATIGGGLSHGALFFGSARYGSAAENVLGLEVATADGALLRTGQWALRADLKPVFRSFGPDLTGLFVHDGGAFGVKTRASFRLIRTPGEIGYVSFAFGAFDAAALALSEIARAGVAEEAYVLDPSVLDVAAEASRGVRPAISAARAMVRSAGGGFGALRALGELARGGRTVAPAGSFTLHCVAAGNSRNSVAADLATARSIAQRGGGRRIPATIPRMARADPFPNLNSVLGPDGSRWVALNAKVAHSEGVPLIRAHQALVSRHAGELTDHGVRVTYLLSALATHSFSFEAVFHWSDSWLPIHAEKVDPAVLAGLSEPAPNPAAHALVAAMRQETVALFRECGAASNQIGRTYPYIGALADAPATLVRGIKRLIDPQGLMNPGVLGL